MARDQRQSPCGKGTNRIIARLKDRLAVMGWRSVMRLRTVMHQRWRERGLRHAFADVSNPHARRMARAMASLPDTEHEIVRLALVEDLSNEQIAARLRLPVAQVERRFALALRLTMDSIERQEKAGW